MTNYTREVAYRIFSDALKTATVVPRGDEEYATQYVKLRTGEHVNRVFVCGTLTELDDVGTDTPFWRMRISDPKGHFDATIGQYSPVQAQNAIENIDVPSFVAVVGKIKSREYEDRTYFTIAVESITEVDEKTYDFWVNETEEHTKARQESANA